MSGMLRMGEQQADENGADIFPWESKKEKWLVVKIINGKH